MISGKVLTPQYPTNTVLLGPVARWMRSNSSQVIIDANQCSIDVVEMSLAHIPDLDTIVSASVDHGHFCVVGVPVNNHQNSFV